MKVIQTSARVVESKYKRIIFIFLLFPSIIFGYANFEGKTMDVSEVAIELIEVYQHYLSDKVPFVTCKYELSCSEYSKKAIKEHGLGDGIVLSFKRIHSCM